MSSVRVGLPDLMAQLDAQGGASLGGVEHCPAGTMQFLAAVASARLPGEAADGGQDDDYDCSGDDEADALFAFVNMARSLLGDTAGC